MSFFLKIQPKKPTFTPLRVPSKKRTLFLYIVSVVVIIVAITIFYLNFAHKIEAAWFDDNWGYRKAITVTVTSSSSNITNLETLLTIDTTGITSKLQTNCEDLRFTNQNGKILSYYIDTCSDNSATNKIWIMADFVPKNTTTYTVYMYYGNPSARSKSDGEIFSKVRGLVGYWTLNESTAVTAFDASTKANDTTDTSTTTTSSGKYANARVFDGANSYIAKTSSLSGIPNNNAAQTITAWINISSATGLKSIFVPSNDSSSANQFRINAANLEVSRYGGGTNITSSTTLSTSTWYFVAWTWNGTTNNLYINGSLDTTTSTTPQSGTPSQIVIGAYDAGSGVENFNGTLDDIRFYSRALSSSEITAQYQNPGQFAYYTTSTSKPTTAFASEEKSNGPVGFWRLDEGTGTTAQDSTVNNNDGTLVNTPVWQSEDMCISGKCLQFSSGSSEYIATTDIDSFSPSENDITISLWARVPVNATTSGNAGCGGAGSYMMAKGVVSNWEWGLENDNNTLVCFTAWQADGTNNAVVNSTRTVNDGLWHFYEVTYDYNNLLSLYIDGVLVSSTSSFTGSMSNGTAVVTVASRLSGNYFDGYIDEPKIYNYVRSAAQVKLDYLNSGINKGAGERLGRNPENNYQALNNGLVGYWKMDEVSWTNNCSTATVTDSSGNSNTGNSCPNSTGPTGGATGKFGNGGSFDGSDDYIDIATSSSLNPTGDFSYGGWVNPTSASANQGIMRKMEQSSNVGYRLTLRSNGTIWCDIGTTSDSSGSKDTVSYSAGSWQHILCIRSGSFMYVYVNGVLKDTASTDSSSISAVNNLLIGRNGSSEILAGSLDEVRLYSHALLPSEVSILYNFAPGPAAYWKLDEKSGQSAKDNSGNGNTITNFNSNPPYALGKYGSGIYFDGLNSYLGIAEATAFDFGATTDSVTLSAWVKTTQNVSTIATITAKFDNAGGNLFPYSIYLNSSEQPVFLIGDGSTTSGSVSATAINDGSWHYITGVRDVAADLTYIYVDGVLMDSDTDVTTTTTANNDSLTIGNAGTAYTEYDFNGYIDDVKIYNYARTQKQIVEDMNAGHPAPGSPVGSPVGYWKMDEGYGTTTYDSSINQLNATLSGFASPATATSGWTQHGKFAKALYFDGSNDYLYLANSGNLQPAQISVSAWVLLKSYTGDPTIYNKIVSGGSSVLFYVDNTATALRAGLNCCSGWPFVTDTESFPLDSWQHVVFTYDGSALKLYRNGILRATTSTSATISYDSSPLLIGSYATTPTGLWNGMIDEMKVYSSALSSEQVKIDYNRAQAVNYGTLGVSTSDGKTASDSAATSYCVPGDTSTCNPPVGEWKFEEGSSTSANDASGNGNTGSVAPSTDWVTGKIGKALQFDGTTNAYVLLPSASTYISATQTVSFWVKLKAQIGVDFWSFASAVPSGENMGWMVQYGDNDSICSGGIGFLVRKWTPEVNSVFCKELTVGQWYHLTSVWDGSNAMFYVDGVLFGSSASAGPTTGTTTGCIGGDSRASNCSDQNPNSVIDQLRIYNYVRSPAQIAYEYNRGLPLAHWKFDECQGTTANDSVANSYPGTIVAGSSGTQTSVGDCNTSSTMWDNGQSGKYNYSLNFDSTDDYVFLGDQSNLELTTFTISGWANRAGACSFSTCTIFSKGMSGNTGYALTIDSVSGNYKACIHIRDNTQVVCGTTTISTDNWYHIAGSIDGTTVKVYVNGRLDASESQSSTPTFSTEMAKIGNRNNNNDIPINGKLDDVKIFNYVLTARQIEMDYNQGSGVRYGPNSGAP